MRNKREESFRRGRVDNKNLENTDNQDSVHRVVKKCLKNTVVQNDPLRRTKAIIDDADTRKRKSVLKQIPHRLCPLSLDPKKDINEYLFFQDFAQKKHLKFQSGYLNKLNCARHRSTAQFSQDIRLHRSFFKFAKNLVFVEVGAFDGVVFSNTYFEVCNYTFFVYIIVSANTNLNSYKFSTQEMCLGWRGLCVEPQRRFAGIIQKSRTCGVVNAAVSPSDDETIEIRVGVS